MKHVSQTSASDAARTLANWQKQQEGKHKPVRKGGYLGKSKRPGASSRRNRKKAHKQKK